VKLDGWRALIYVDRGLNGLPGTLQGG
jgi:hypothetical protein